MKRKGMHLLCAALALSGAPANAATRIATNAEVEGGKGSTVVTPINDSIEDIMRAAADADGVAARSNTILDLDAYPIPVNLTALPSAPLATTGAISPIAPVAVAGAKESLLPYLSIAGLLLVPLLFGGGDDDGNGAIPPGQPTPPGLPSGPGEGPPPGPIPAVPEPATWLMMLLGFGAVGTMLRAAPRSSRREPSVG